MAIALIQFLEQSSETVEYSLQRSGPTWARTGSSAMQSYIPPYMEPTGVVTPHGFC